MVIVTKNDLKPKTKALIFKAQQHALRTNNITHRLDISSESNNFQNVLCHRKDNMTQFKRKEAN